MPKDEPTAAWKAGLIASGGMALVFAIFGGFSTGYSAKSVGLWALTGALLGAIAVPDFQPESFRYPALWQISFAILGCLLIAFHFDAEPFGYFVAVLAGGVLGYFAPLWTKYINVP